MAECCTPPRVKCKRDRAELNTPIKIPASPFLQQIGYGTGMYLMDALFILVIFFFVSEKHVGLDETPISLLDD